MLSASQLAAASEAISRYVADGDYVVWECNYLQRGPSALIREIIEYEGSHGRCTQTFIKKVRKQTRPPS